MDIGECLCRDGFDGQFCEAIQVCPEDCHDHGDCIKGQCQCKNGWEGTMCQFRRVPSGHGIILSRAIPGNTTNHTIYQATVQCEKMWKGCDSEVINASASNSSLIPCCATSVCEDPEMEPLSDCVEWRNFTNNCEPVLGEVPAECVDDSKLEKCPQDCLDHGSCQPGGVCKCDIGYFGDDCSIYLLPQGGHGKLVFKWEVEPQIDPNSTVSRVSDFDVVCDPGYALPYCLDFECPLNCSNHGSCRNSTCDCSEGWKGLGCEMADPNYNPNKVGCFCLLDRARAVEAHLSQDDVLQANHDDACVWICPPKDDEILDHQVPGSEPSSSAAEGATGPAASRSSGTEPGQSKASESRPDAPLDEKAAEETASDSTSAQVSECTEDCNGHGECIDRVCHCQYGFFGLTCKYNRTEVIYMTDPEAKCRAKDCSNRGLCVLDQHLRATLPKEKDYDSHTINGLCQCVPGFNKSTECLFGACPYCNGHGECQQGNVSSCFCGRYWYGMYCENNRPTKNKWFRSRHSAQIGALYGYGMAIGTLKSLDTSAFLVGGTGRYGQTMDVYKFHWDTGFVLLGSPRSIPPYPASPAEQVAQLKLRKQAPGVREGAGLAFVTLDNEQGFLYLFGGVGWEDEYINEQPIRRNPMYYNDMWKFDVLAEHWLAVEPVRTVPPPTGRTKCGFALIEKVNILLMFGGSRYRILAPSEVRYLHETGDAHVSKNVQTYLGDLWYFSVRSKTWTQVKARELPAARHGHSMTFIPDTSCVVLFGGTDGVTHFNDAWIFDFDASQAKLRVTKLDGIGATKKFSLTIPGPVVGDPESTEFKAQLKLPELVAKREQSPATSKEATAAYLLQVLDPLPRQRDAEKIVLDQLAPKSTNQTNTSRPSWVPEIPGRAFHVAVVTPAQDLIVAFGETGSPLKLVSDVWRLSLKTIEWEKLDVTESGHGFPKGRDMLAATYFDDKLLTYGGLDARSEFIDEVWMLDLEPDLSQPSLVKPDNWEDIVKSITSHDLMLLAKELEEIRVEAKAWNEKHQVKVPPPATPTQADQASADSTPKIESWPTGTETQPSASCAQILESARAAGAVDSLQDGPYWLSFDGGPATKVPCLFSVEGGGWTQVFDDFGQEQVRQDLSVAGNLVSNEALVFVADTSVAPFRVPLIEAPYETTLKTITSQPWIGPSGTRFKPFGVPHRDKTRSLFLTDDSVLAGTTGVLGGVKCDETNRGVSPRQTGYSTTPNGLLMFGLTQTAEFARGGTCSYEAVQANKRYLVRKLYIRSEIVKTYQGIGSNPKLPAQACSQILEKFRRAPDGSYWLQPPGANTPRLVPCLMSSFGGGWTLAFDDSKTNQIVQDSRFVSQLPLTAMLVVTTEDLEKGAGRIVTLLSPGQTLASYTSKPWYGMAGFEQGSGGISEFGSLQGLTDHADGRYHWTVKYLSASVDSAGYSLKKSKVLMIHDSGDISGGDSAVQENIIGGTTCREGVELLANCVKPGHDKVPQTCYPLTPNGVLGFGSDLDKQNFVVGGCSYLGSYNLLNTLARKLWVR